MGRLPKISTDEQKALAFVALMLVLSALARGLAPGAAPVETDAEPVDVAALAGQDSALAREQAERSRPLAADERIDVNRADAAELERLPGVGPATARAIVAHRDSAGPLREPDELLRVRGIGPAKLAGMREHVRLESWAPAMGGTTR